MAHDVAGVAPALWGVALRPSCHALRMTVLAPLVSQLMLIFGNVGGSGCCSSSGRGDLSFLVGHGEDEVGLVVLVVFLFFVFLFLCFFWW